MACRFPEGEQAYPASLNGSVQSALKRLLLEAHGKIDLPLVLQAHNLSQLVLQLLGIRPQFGSIALKCALLFVAENLLLPLNLAERIRRVHVTATLILHHGDG